MHKTILSLIFIAIALLPIPSIAQDDEQPLLLSYVTYTNETGYDAHLMDANTGEIIFTYDSGYFDCVGTFSPDMRWSTFSERNLEYESGWRTDLYDIETNTISALPYLKSNLVVWSPDSKQLIYRSYDPETGDNGFFLYDLETQNREFFVNQDAKFVRWLDGDLMYVIKSGEDINLIHGNQIHEIELPEGVEFSSMRLSPHNTYYTYSLPSGVIKSGTLDGYEVQWDMGSYLYLVSTSTGEHFQINSDTFLRGSTVWSPDETVFAYVAYDPDIESETLYFYDLNTHASVDVANTTSPSERQPHLPTYSPTGRFAAYTNYTYGELGTSFSTAHTIDLHTYERTDFIDNMAGVLWLRWLTPVTLVYRRTRSIESDLSTTVLGDLWLYDIMTNKHTQLTDTPEVDEYLNCTIG